MERFLIALQFLTVTPIRLRRKIQDADFGAAVSYFPLVGLFIGVLLAAAAFLCSPLPVLVKSALILFFSAFITGAIHLDGFADTCDGFYGAKSREKILEIMRDVHIGTIATVAVTILLIFKFASFASMRGPLLYKALIASAVFSRWAQSLACVSGSYARREGKAKYFVEYARKKEIFVWGPLCFLLFMIMMRLEGAVIFLLALGVVYLFLRYAERRISGVSGDTIGAASEISEVLILLLFSLCSFAG